nr:ubiquitin hydrolase [Tanacetum cinerariifolium]
MIVQGPIFQGEGSTVPVESRHILADKAASTGVSVRYEGAATTVTSLDAGHGSGNIGKTPSMPHDSPLLRVNTLGCNEGRMILKELTVVCTTLSQKVESLEEDLKQTKKVYRAAYTKLIIKVKKLEKTVKISKARRKAKIVVSDKEVDLEDPSKQGRISITGASIPVSTASMIDKGKGIMEEAESDLIKTNRQQEQERLGLETASEDYKAVPKLAEARSTKRDAAKELDQGKSKKQKIGESSEPRNKDVEKEYPLSRGILTYMLSAKLLVEGDSEMGKELIRKIFMQVERPKKCSVWKHPLKKDEFTDKPVATNTKSSEEETKAVRKNADAPIIKEWVSDDEEDNVTQPKIVKKIVKPRIVKKEFVKHRQQENTTRKTIKNVDHNRENTHRPRGNQRKWNNMMSQKLGSNFKMFNKACYVKEYSKNDKMGSKPDKNEKRGEAEKSRKQLQ